MKNFTKSNTSEKIESVIEVSPDILLFPDKSDFPVLKIDTDGKILYANSASFKHLHEWLNGKNAYLPKYVIHINPDVLNPDADFSISIHTETADVINFDVIGFKESGFIGLYGFLPSRRNEIVNYKHEMHVVN